MLPTEWGKVRPASCRDKGRRGVDEGALCLSWWGCDRVASRNPDHSSCHQDKHKAQYISLKALPRAAQRREDQAGRQNIETAPQAQRAQVEVSGASWVCTCCRPA